MRVLANMERVAVFALAGLVLLPSCTIERIEPLPDEPLRELRDAEREILDDAKWDDWVGWDIAIWVSVAEQRLRVIRGREIYLEMPCSTSEKGAGNLKNSEQTPLGWHRIVRKLGYGEPVGAVFRWGEATGKVWAPGSERHSGGRDGLILTRVLFLEGLEQGVNRGGAVDTRKRVIYIHGTDEEERIGTPASHGCIRLTNRDVLKLFEAVAQDSRVLITP